MVIPKTINTPNGELHSINGIQKVGDTVVVLKDKNGYVSDSSIPELDYCDSISSYEEVIVIGSRENGGTSWASSTYDYILLFSEKMYGAGWISDKSTVKSYGIDESYVNKIVYLMPARLLFTFYKTPAKKHKQLYEFNCTKCDAKSSSSRKNIKLCGFCSDKIKVFHSVDNNKYLSVAKDLKFNAFDYLN